MFYLKLSELLNIVKGALRQEIPRKVGQRSHQFWHGDINKNVVMLKNIFHLEYKSKNENDGDNAFKQADIFIISNLAIFMLFCLSNQTIC